ncbi:MAG: TrmB family transcriptional regulator [Nanobdellota archaeon]
MIKILQDIGLSEREAKLYLALLDFGQTTIGPLVEKTRIPSSKIYEVMNRLETKGLANHIIIKKTKQFQASDPEILLDKLNEKTATFKEHLDQLKKRQALAQEQQYAEFYEGKQAVFSLLRNSIKNAQENETYYSFDFDDEYQQDDIAIFFSNLALRRAEKKLNTKILAKKESKNIIEYELPKLSRQKMNIKYTDIPYPEGIVILGEDVIMIEFEGEPSAVRIKSKVHAKNYKQLFLSIYEGRFTSKTR